MQKRRAIKGGITIGMLSLIFSLSSVAEQTMILSIGQNWNRGEFPSQNANTEASGFTLQAKDYSVSQVFPSDSPKGQTLVQLPDIIPVYAGFYDNDLAYYVDNDMLEPLDLFFTEVGVKPEEVIPERLLPALSYKGHIWALPNRMNCFVLSYAEPVTNRLGIKHDFTSLKSALDIAERISKESYEEGPVQAIFSDLPQEYITALVMWLGRSLEPDMVPATTLTELMFDYIARGVFEFIDYTPSSIEDYAVFLEVADTMVFHPGRRLILMPEKIFPDDETPMSNVVFLESFALKKNNDNKIKAGKRFLSWLMEFETQKAIIKGRSNSFPYRHVPALKTVLEPDNLAELQIVLTDIGEITGLLSSGIVTPADPQKYIAKRNAIKKCRDEAEYMLPVDKIMYYFNPIEVKEVAPAKKVTAESFDAY